MLLRSIVVGLLVIGGGGATAQELVVGSYTGRTTSTKFPQGVELVVESVSDGLIKGKVIRTIQRLGQGGSNCSGTYVVEGKQADGSVRLRTIEKGGAAGDCAINLVVKVEGNKLIGKLNGLDAELSK